MLFDAAGKHAPTITAYHGTSTSRLRSILKHGLVPNKPGRWSSDTSHGAQRSRKSFQGVYFSPNLMTAYTSATDLILHEKNGGNRLIVVAQIQPMSSLPDEDSIKFNIPYIHYDLAKIFAAFKLNKWSEDVKKNMESCVGDIMRYENGEKIWDETPDPSGRPRSDLESFSRIARQLFKVEVERRLAHELLRGQAVKDYLAKAYEALQGEYVPFDELPAKLLPASVDKAEEKLRKTLEVFLRKVKDMHVKAIRDGSPWTNLRLTSPVKYAGSNRILAIVEIQPDNKPIILHYGKLPEDFTKKYASHIGAMPPIVKKTSDFAAAHPDAFQYFKFTGERGVRLTRVKNKETVERTLRKGDVFGLKPSFRKEVMSLVFQDAPGETYFLPVNSSNRLLKYASKTPATLGLRTPVPSHLMATRSAWIAAKPVGMGDRKTWVWTVLAKWLNAHRGIKAQPLDLYEECMRLHNGVNKERYAGDAAERNTYIKQLYAGRNAVVRAFGFRLRYEDVVNLASWIRDPRKQPKGLAARLMTEHDKRWKVADGRYVPIRTSNS